MRDWRSNFRFFLRLIDEATNQEDILQLVNEIRSEPYHANHIETTRGDLRYLDDYNLQALDLLTLFSTLSFRDKDFNTKFHDQVLRKVSEMARSSDLRALRHLHAVLLSRNVMGKLYH